MNNSQRVTLNLIFSLAIIAIIIFSYLLPINLDFPFMAYSSVTTKTQFIPVEPFDDIAALVSRFLWSFKALDLIDQAFVLFAAVLGCLALLKAGDE